jgi:cystathionine beta-lyase
MRRRFGWETSADLVLPVADLVQGTFAPIMAFSDPGDGVILQVPNYPPFREAIMSTERKLISLHMRDSGNRHEFSLDELEGLVDARTRIFVLCNPQNPTGRVFSRDELLAIARFAVEHDLVIVSDEIHSDLVYPGRTHIPIASLGPEIAARTITLNSATKSFNIPAAWDEGRPWLDAVMAHLLEARRRVIDVLSAEPGIRVHAPEATYLAWLDCTGLGLQTSAFEFFLDKAKVGLSAGETFEPSSTQFARLNFATSLPILDEILGRMVKAARAR